MEEWLAGGRHLLRAGQARAEQNGSRLSILCGMGQLPRQTWASSADLMCMRSLWASCMDLMGQPCCSAPGTPRLLVTDPTYRAAGQLPFDAL